MLTHTPQTSKFDFRSHARSLAITAAWIAAMLALAVASLVFTSAPIDAATTDEPSGRVVPAQPISPTGEVDQSSIQPIHRLDHSGVEAHAMAHASDAPRASIAAYDP